MKHSVLFLLFISLAGTPVYNHALSWNNDDLTKMGIAAAGVAALLYFFNNSPSTESPPPYRDTHEFDEFSYSEDEQGSLPSDFFAQQRQPAPQSAGAMSNLPAVLCVGVLGYFGYNYLQTQGSDKPNSTNSSSVNTQSEAAIQSAQPIIKESVFAPTPIESEMLTEIEEKVGVVNFVTSRITLGNAGLAIGFIAVCYGISYGRNWWENPTVQQATLHNDISHAHKRGLELYTRACEMLETYQNEGLLKQKEACAINTYLSGKYDELCNYLDRSKTLSRSFGGYRTKLTAADMASIKLYESKANYLLKEIKAIERACRSKFKAQVFGQELVEMFAKNEAKMHAERSEQVDYPVKTFVEDDVQVADEEVQTSFEITQKNDSVNNSLENEESISVENKTLPEKKSSN